MSTEWKPLEEIVPLEVFRGEVLAWAKRLGVEPKEIRVREMKRKWASCSSAGRLTFDRDLLRQPAPVRTVVILHELLHLRLPTHNKLFKSLLSAYFHEKYPNMDIPEIRVPRNGGPGHAASHKGSTGVR